METTQMETVELGVVVVATAVVALLDAVTSAAYGPQP